MATFVVMLAPASEGGQLRLKISEAIRQNLPFGFPDHRFEFVEAEDVREQSTVVRASAKPDELAEAQAAVDRIATTAARSQAPD